MNAQRLSNALFSGKSPMRIACCLTLGILLGLKTASAHAGTPPIITPIADQTTYQNKATAAIPFTIGDAETPTDSMSLVGTSSDLNLVTVSNIVFGGSGANRTVTISPTRNQWGSCLVRVRVNDADGGTNSTLFTVTVTPNPTITTITDQTIEINTSGTPISFTIGDAVLPVDDLSLVGTSSNLLLIPASNIVFGGSGASRTVTITPARNQAGTGRVRVRVNDSNGGTNSTLFTVTVPPTTQPTITSIGDQTINEDTPTAAITFTIGDAETPVGNLSLVATTDNPTLFPVSSMVFGGSGANRTVTITPASNRSGSGHVRVRVNDADGGTNSTLFTIAVNPVNDNPTITSIADQTIQSNTSTAAIPFTLGDTETPAGSLSLVATSSNMWLIPVGNIMFGGSGANRTVTITPAERQWGTGLVRVRVNDPNGGTNSSLFTVVVNAQPTITAIANQTLQINQSTAAIPFTIGDKETPADSLSLAATTDNPVLIPVSNIVLGGSGGNRTVTVTPTSNTSGTASVRVSVSDANGGTNSRLFTVMVNAPPTISTIANQSTNEGTPTAAIPFTIGDVETPVGNLSLVATTDDPTLFPVSNVVFGGSGANRTVTITPASNRSGSGHVRVRVTDADGGTDSTLFTVTVNPVNDSPTITNIVDQSITRGTSSAPIPFTIGDVETPAASLNLTATTDNLALIPISNIVFGGSGANRTVNITPTGFAGTANVRIRVTDADGGTSSTLFNVTVTAETSLTINITGLGTMPGDVTVAGPNGYSKHLTSAQSLGIVETGTYTITASTVTDTSQPGLGRGNGGTLGPEFLARYPHQFVQPLYVTGAATAAVDYPTATMTLQIPTKDDPSIQVPLDFVLIPAGSFTMGSADPMDSFEGTDATPPHTVSLTTAFYMSKTPLTQAQWKAVMGGTSSPFWFKGDTLPVESVSWDYFKETFLPELNAVLPGLEFRLPSEAEWEYACRAGTTTGYFFGEESDDLYKYGWSDDTVTHPVATKAPNPWGLYDIVANVLQWCEDDLHVGYAGAPIDGSPWVDSPRGFYRIKRGGGWFTDVSYRSAHRQGGDPTWGAGNAGFRLVMPVPRTY